MTLDTFSTYSTNATRNVKFYVCICVDRYLRCLLGKSGYKANANVVSWETTLRPNYRALA